MTRSKRSLAAFVLFVLAATCALGQTSNGTLAGTVTDPSGAAVVGAAVSLKSLDTEAVRTTLTISNGSYRIESVPPGTYSVTVKAAGFAETVVDGLSIPASVITTSDVVLKLGTKSDVVEVKADNSSINTDNAQISGTISTAEISNLPLNSLSAYSMALTLPGVTSAEQGGFSNGVNFTVGGGRPRANNFLIEGQDNNDAGIMGQGLQPENIEAQKEIIIIENDYTSEYGHGAGSVSNLIFKSGTNQFHGSVFERLLNSSIDANDHYNVRNDIPKALYRENIFGFSIGGPIVRNKLFAFGSYQWDNYRATANLSTLTVPSTAGFATLNALPSNPRLSNLIEAYGDLVGNPAQLLAAGGQDTIALGADPVTGMDRGTVQIGYTQRRLGDLSNSPELDLKGDYIPGSKDTVSLRYIRTTYLTPYDTGNFPGQLPGFDTDQNGASHNAGIVETHIFNPNLLNEFRVSYGRIGFIFGLPSSTTSDSLFGTPGVSVSSLTGYGIPTNVPQGRFHNTYQFQDSVSWTHGKHFVKVGTDISDTRVRDAIPFNFYGTISYADVPGGYTGLANLIDDFGGKGSISQNFGSPTARPRLVSQNYFAQDTWKATQNLSLDIGFRYEYNGAPFNAPGTPYPGIDYGNAACFPSPGV
ncbi:MAG TPA: carboxypeptidase regulatory-like domain-containing protein, partial [Terracidiphilus sp.]